MDNGKIDLEKRDAIKIWEEFSKKNKKFLITPDEEKVDSLAKGVVNNKKRFGLKFCPCRLRNKDFEKDLKLICPCNFLIQKTWKEKGECWCGLFVKRESNFS